MAMHIYICHYIFLLNYRIILFILLILFLLLISKNQIINLCFNSSDFRMQSWIWFLKFSIEIITWHWSPIVSNYYTINIYHWYYQKNYSFSQLLCLEWITYYTFYKSLHHPRTVWLSWVYSCSNNYIFFTMI
jgi:hypothetical protein